MGAANVKPFEVVVGPLGVAYAPTGTPFPALASYPELGSIEPGDTIAAASGTVPWVCIGYTEGGVKVGHPQTVVEIRADQVTAPIKAIRTEEGLELSFNMISLTSANYRLALNQAYANTLSSVKLYRGGSQVQTVALVLFNKHLSPLGDFPIAYEIPAAFEAGSPEEEFTKDNKVQMALSFHAIADPNRLNEESAFGQINVGTS